MTQTKTNETTGKQTLYRTYRLQEADEAYDRLNEIDQIELDDDAYVVSWYRNRTRKAL